MNPTIIIKNDPLDVELCQALGEPLIDFIVTCFDGVPLNLFSTPEDSPRARERHELFVQRLNDKTVDSKWPEFFEAWRDEFCQQFKLPHETEAASYHPHVTWQIHRVCVAYTERLSSAVTLFEKIASRLTNWIISKRNGGSVVEIEGHEFLVRHCGEDLPRVVSLAVLEVLKITR